MLWFLNLFALFREAVSARIRAEDEARLQRSRAERLEERNAELLKDLLDTKNQVIDVLARKSLGSNVFAKADPSAEISHPEILGSRRQQASDLRNQMRHEFTQKLHDFYKSVDDSSASAI